MRRIASTAIAGILLLGACGGDSPGGSNPLATIVLAAEKTEQAGTARMSMDMEMEGPQGLITATGDGVFDMADKRGELTMDMEMPDAPPGTPGLGTTSAVYDGTVVYMKMPAFSGQLPGGKTWIRFDLQTAGEQLGLDMGALMQSGTSDPTQTLQYLRGASGEVETLGEEEVRGATATHYRATLLFDKIVEGAPADLQERLKPTIELLKDWVGTDRMPIEVWIDDEGRAVRVHQSFEYAAGPAAGTSMKMTMDMYDFGTEVDVEMPPASQVADLEELMKGAGQAPAAP